MTITLNNFSAGYERHPAVHHISGVFPSASLTAIVGPNGGGKSTLLKALIGILRPMTGSIDCHGIASRDIAYLPQQSEVDRSFPLNVADVVALGLWPKIGAFGGVSAAQQEDVMRALNEVGMASFGARPIEALSTGQWQRVLFARLIVQNAQAILLDEPFAAIDSRTAHDLTHILQHWQKEGRTVIAVMHDLASVRIHFPQTLMLARELVAWGSTAEALRDVNLARAQELSDSWTENAGACERDEINSPPLAEGVRGRGAQSGEQGSLMAPPPNLPRKGGGTHQHTRHDDGQHD